MSVLQIPNNVLDVSVKMMDEHLQSYKKSAINIISSLIKSGYVTRDEYDNEKTQARINYYHRKLEMMRDILFCEMKLFKHAKTEEQWVTWFIEKFQDPDTFFKETRQNSTGTSDEALLLRYETMKNLCKRFESNTL